MHDVALMRIGQAIALRRPHPPLAAHEWLLRFAPSPVAAGLPAPEVGARAVHVRIDGVALKHLRSVRISQLHGTASMQVDSVPDGRSGHIAAGELVVAMASQFGLPGMTLDISLMQLDASLTSVSITVVAASAEDAERAAVVVVAERAP
jgi:hypothetical protein